MVTYLTRNKSFVALMIITLMAAFSCGLTLNTTLYNFFKLLFLVLLPLLAFFGAGRGYSRVKACGGINATPLTYALALLCLGVLAWGTGQLIWGGYVLLSIQDVPYPSLADFAFMAAYPCWLAGLHFLMNSISGDKQVAKEIGAFLPLLVVVVVTNLFVIAIAKYQVTSTNFLDLYYPEFSGVLVGVTLLVIIWYIAAQDQIHAVYKTASYILLAGFSFQFLGDFLFTYETKNQLYYNGGWPDRCFTLSMFLIALALSTGPLVPFKDPHAIS